MNPLGFAYSGLMYSKNWTNSFLGRKLYANTAKLTDNLTGNRKINQVRSETDDEISQTDVGDTLRSDHALVVPELYDQDRVESIAVKFDQLMEDEDNYVERGKGKYSINLVSNDHDFRVLEVLPELRSLMNERAIEIVEDYYQSHFEITSINAYRNYHIPRDVWETDSKYLPLWHCDRRPVSRFKLFVILTETTEQHGPLHLIPKTETKRLIRNGEMKDWERDKLGKPGRIDELAKDVVKFTGPPGNAAFANTQKCLHRAGLPEDGNHRDIVQFCFQPTATPVDNQLDKLEQKYPVEAEGNR